MEQSRFKFLVSFHLTLLFILNPILLMAADSHHRAATSNNIRRSAVNSASNVRVVKSAEMGSESDRNKSNDKAVKPAISEKRTESKSRKEKGAKVINIPAQQKKPLLKPGQSATLLPNGGWLLIGGEQDGQVSAALAVVSSSGEVLETLPVALEGGRAWHTATMLPDGRILILGGVDKNNLTIETTEVFDTATQTLSTLRLAGLTSRSAHSATLLTDGNVLVVGGKSANGATLGSVELWNSETGAVKVLPINLLTARSKQSAALLPNGDVVIWGGISSRGGELYDGEQFSLITEQFTSLGAVIVEEDPAPPYLVASMPRTGDADVSIKSRVAMRFSKALQAETVNTANITLTKTDQTAVAAKVVPAENGMLAFLTPGETLEPATTYVVTINKAQDSSGAGMTVTKISFTTAGTGNHGDHTTGQQNHHPASNSAKGQAHDQMQMDDHVPRGGLPDKEEWIPTSAKDLRTWRSDKPLKERNTPLPLLAEKGVTALSGRVMTLEGDPLPNVTLQIGDVQTRSDETGRFLLAKVPEGRQVVVINGGTASTLNKPYAMFDHGVDIVPGITTVMPFHIWLPVIDTRNVTQLPELTTNKIVARTNRIPGLEVEMPAGARLRYPSGKILRNLTITPIPLDRSPFPLPPGAGDGSLLTLQLHSAKVEAADGKLLPGLRVVYPNNTGLDAGERTSLWNYEPRGSGWYIYGYGTVTPDGRQIVPDVGTDLQSMHCVVYAMGNPNRKPSNGPPCTDCGQEAGEPVDLQTGLFIYNKTDLVLPDTMSISLARTYRNGDTQVRAFGVGTSHPYSMFLVGGNAQTAYGNWVEIVLPDGGTVRYEANGYNWLPHTATPSAFYGSILSVNSTLNTYDVLLRNGTTLRFDKILGGASTGGKTDLRAIVDRYGNALRIENNRIISPNGRWIELTKDAANGNRITQAKDNTGRTVTYTYDAGGRLWKVTDAANRITEYGYDSYGQILTIKDPRNITYLTNEYDLNGRVFRQTQPDGSTFGFAYTQDASNKVVQSDVTDERGNVRRTTFNAAGFKLTDTLAFGKPEEQVYTFERSPTTNMVSKVTDALGRKTTYVYNTKGNPTSVTAMAETAEAVTSTAAYEPVFNQVSSVTDPLNHTTSFGYNSKGDLTSVTDALNHQSTFGYDSEGQIISATDALNHTTAFGYDGGDLVSVTDPLMRTVSRFVDPAGRPTHARNPLGQSASVEYDSQNQVKKLTNPLGGEVSAAYDENGNFKSLTDPRLGQTSYTYDSMDRVKTYKDALQGATSTSSIDYDLAGNVTKVTDRRGKINILKYDALSRNTFVGFGMTGTDASPSYESTITSTYDKGNRLLQVADSGSGTITYEYDNFDRLKKETTASGVVSYTYDAAGRQKTMTVTGQPTVNYDYDNANRLTSIVKGAETVGFGYDDSNRPTSLTLPNGVATEYGYDNASQLTAITYKKGAATLGNLTYGYDQIGRRNSMGGSLARTQIPPTLSLAHTYNALNQLKQRGAATLNYDNEGNLTSDGTTNYTWNARGELTGMTRTGLTASFAYDAFGRRISKTVNGTTTKFLYDGADAVQEQNASGAVTANMLLGGTDLVLSRTEGATTRTFQHDGLGSAIGLIDANGATTTSYAYEPFGVTTQSGAASGNASKYTGREDDGTGLYYYRARYYSPALQRFISQDPIGFSGGDVNLYAYVGNDPVNNTDPSGLSVWKTLIRVFTQSGELISSIRKPLSKDAKLDRIKDSIDEARRRGNHPGPVVQAKDQDGAKTIAEALDPNGAARGPERSGGGYPEHFNPKSGPYKDVHVQWDAPKRLGIMFAPMSMTLGGRKDTTNAQFASAAAWDVISAIDPIFITDAIDWSLGLSCD